MVNQDNASNNSFPQLEKIIPLIFEKRYAEARSLIELQYSLIAPDEAHRLIAISALLSKERGDMEGAFELMRKAISVKPFWLPHHYRLCVMLMEEGRWSDAIAILDKLIRISKAKDDVYFLSESLFRKAICLRELGYTREFERVRADIPEGTTIYLNDRIIGLEDL